MVDIPQRYKTPFPHVGYRYMTRPERDSTAQRIAKVRRLVGDLRLLSCP